ncbi:TPA: hypothetical protein QB628_000001 [Pasteurella multocida]|nr:hypothetical protein [Pasteurella multocida]
MNLVICNHSERIKWQIRRIYRARNIIVHTGNTPEYTYVLIEHIHNYLDILLSTLIKLSSLKRISSVGQGFQYMTLIYNEYSKFLGIEDMNNKNKKNKKESNAETLQDSLTEMDLNKIFKYLS